MDIEMDLLTLLKFVHVSAAVLWVGGGFALILSGFLLAGRSTAEAQLAVVRASALLGPRLFMPVSLVTLASGVTLLFAGGWGWQPFTVLGLAGVVFTAGFGMIVLGPSCERALKIEQTLGAPAAIAFLRRTQRLAFLDYAVQFAIVFLMVVKPGWQDFAIFAGLGAVVALAVLAAMRPIARMA
jgi:Predicted integral membrane protein (DUF2269)